MNRADRRAVLRDVRRAMCPACIALLDEMGEGAVEWLHAECVTGLDEVLWAWGIEPEE